MNPMQRDLLASAMQKLPKGGSVIIATDHDSGGIHLAKNIKDIAATTDRDDLSLREHRPQKEGQDWSAVLKTNMAKLSPA
jgi:tRNA G46 methylase TrmB